MSQLSTGLGINKRGRLAPMRDDIHFGIFGIDKYKLKYNELSICRLTTKGKIHGFPNAKISDGLKSAILALAQGSNPDVSSLSYIEKTFLIKLMTRSRLQAMLPEEITGKKESNLLHSSAVLDQLKNKLLINLGEIHSSNDSHLLKQETSMIIMKLLEAKIFTLDQVNKIRSSYHLP